MDEFGIAKLGDFGSSEFLKNGIDSLKNTSGTYLFLAPECRDPNVKQFSGVEADVWALGVTAYALVYNELPFWSDTEIGIFDTIKNQELKFDKGRNISEGLKELLKKMLEKDPNQRITINELKREKWLNEGFAVTLESKEADILANYTEEELKIKGVPFHSIVFAVSLIVFILTDLQKKLARKITKIVA